MNKSFPPLRHFWLEGVYRCMAGLLCLPTSNLQPFSTCTRGLLLVPFSNKNLLGLVCLSFL